MKILQNQPLNQLTTMKLGGMAKYSCIVLTKEDVVKAAEFANANNLKVLTIGQGSNIIFSDTGYNGLVVINKIAGLKIHNDGLVEACAGEVWDNLAKQTVENELVGIEALSLIPGTVGAAPVNNIGAYGQEIKDTLVSVQAYDTFEKNFIELSQKKCEFSYRNSIFKNKWHGRYIITKVILQLKKLDDSYTPPNYPSLYNELSNYKVINPGTVREAVIKVRSSKLPNPAIIPNTGSFFKNPIVSNETAQKLKNEYPDMPQYPHDANTTKLSAGWLIDNAGMKGLKIAGMKVYDKQALVLVNETASSFDDLAKIIDHIKLTINKKYAVNLEIEPEIIYDT